MTIEVHIWSDIACPWCYVGKRRFEAALARSGISVQSEFHSFELDPRAAPQQNGRDYVERLAQKYQTPRTQAAIMLERMVATGAECGISFHFEQAIWANTFNAHRLLKWAKHLGADQQNALKEALFQAHFCDGRDLNQTTDLLSVVSEQGLEADAASAILSSDQWGQQVREDENEARRIGVTGVPFFVIGQFAVGGAQQPETFQEILHRAIAAEPESLPQKAEGKVCDGEVC